MLTVYNTLSRKKEIFKPINAGKVGIYVCGITVYDFCHLGHARSMVCFDVIVKYLRFLGYEVNYVRNITDIDDKIIDKAAKEDLAYDLVTKKYIEALHTDTLSLGIEPPDFEPLATKNIDPIIKLITDLLLKGYAYQTPSGDICYRVKKFAKYGMLAHKNIDGLLAGARLEVDQEKESPLDFVLWKKAKPNEPFWKSPWGAGRPGWHIECSAMSMEILGNHFDIHGGGLDLQFPHHENEIAQSQAATGQMFANYWLHVGMLQINNEKMAKSAKNFLTIRQVLEQYPAEVVRYFLLTSHYRSPLNYSHEQLEIASKALTRLYRTLESFKNNSSDIDEKWKKKFMTVMDDDFNTPEALAILFDLSHVLNKQPDPKLAATLKALAGLLGILQKDPQDFLNPSLSDDQTLAIETLIGKRNAARQNKDWQQADNIRMELLKQGIEIEDKSSGTTWRKKGH